VVAVVAEAVVEAEVEAVEAVEAEAEVAEVAAEAAAHQELP
jgi:hypothetical protein